MISGDDMLGYENYDFNLEKQRAAERLKELNARSKYRQGETQSKQKKSQPEKSGFLSDFNIPFLSNMGIDSDMALIFGLILILSSEKSDKLLLLALLYILI